MELSLFKSNTLWKCYIFIILLIVSKSHSSACIFYCIFNSAVFIATLPLIASMVKYYNLRSTSIQTILYNCGNKKRISICRQLRFFVPSNIWFHNYLLSSLYKSGHSAHCLNCFFIHCFRFATHNSNKVIFFRCNNALFCKKIRRLQFNCTSNTA
ncbi:hypothetical protein SDC9_136133 [bioreactor metagenome]|uniref:Uncharacterized protein n=1 Tax=bioreactor metagenome TaxID=1076179 RepID=A0A645DIH1_9ZZZZ